MDLSSVDGLVVCLLRCPHASSTTDGYQFTHDGGGAAGGLRGSANEPGRHQLLRMYNLTKFPKKYDILSNRAQIFQEIQYFKL